MAACGSGGVRRLLLHPGQLRRATTAFQGRWNAVTSSSQLTAAVRHASDSAGGKGERTEKEILEWVNKEKDKGWVSKGVYYHDRDADFKHYHIITFLTMAFMIYGAWWFWYKPDFRQKRWAMREAFLVLRERERQGLDPIIKDYVDPAKLELPTEEELEGVELIL